MEEKATSTRASSSKGREPSAGGLTRKTFEDLSANPRWNELLLTHCPFRGAVEIENLKQKDPFNDVDIEFAGGGGKLHIWVRQRNTRKSLTTLTGLPVEFDHAKILKEFRKRFSCSGSLIESGHSGIMIQLQGDHRQSVLDFLTSEGIAEPENIVVHGY
ncbi:translation initiation factor SU [Pelomyxa schiedti]|nr:translation initiation factor SU [Pelomyxa schiedti]